MYRFLLPLLLALSACGGRREEPDNAASREAEAHERVQPETTPVLEVPAAPGNEAAWIAPREGPGPRPTAPYGNLLDAPLVDAPAAR